MSREIVLDILIEVMEKEAFGHLVIRQALDKYAYLEKRDRAFITRLANGTMERAIELDALIDSFSAVKTKKMRPVIRNILRMTAYQIKYMESVPDSAACNEAVKLAKKRGFHKLADFVNGVSRSISRGLADYEPPKEFSVRYSMPQWIVSMWIKQYGKEKTEQILKEFLKEDHTKETIVRCNQSRKPVEHIVDSLLDQNVTVMRDKILPYALHISGYDRLETLEAFQKGWIQVQDISSMLVGEAAKPAKGSFCMDVCAAPGGKSLHLADMMENQGIVESRDLTWEKVSLIQENCHRCEFSCITPISWNAEELDLKKVAKADVVIADLPCSGLGIIGNKPDIKYKMTEEKMESLVMLQRSILKTIQQYVKPGGILIYSTCTIHKGENEDNVKWFLEQFPFQTVPLQGQCWETVDCTTGEKGYCQILPKAGYHSGFFISKFQKGRE